MTWVGYPLEFVRAADSVYLDQAQRDFPDYIRRTLAASQAYGGRYNAVGDFGAIYTASDEGTAWLEVAARYEREGVHGLPLGMGSIGIVVRTGRYVDLTDPDVQAAWNADANSLRAASPNPVEKEHCWELGRAVRAVADFLMAPSAQGAGSNIPLFPDREHGELGYALQSVRRDRVPRSLLQRASEDW